MGSSFECCGIDHFAKVPMPTEPNPRAKTYSFSDKGIVPIAYEDTENYRVTRAFLDNPARMLKHLIGEPRDD